MESPLSPLSSATQQLRSRVTRAVLFLVHRLSFPRCLYVTLPLILIGLGTLYHGWWTALPAHLAGDDSFNEGRAGIATLRSLVNAEQAVELSALNIAAKFGLSIIEGALLLTLLGAALRFEVAVIHRGVLRVAGGLRVVLVDGESLAPAAPDGSGATTLLLYPSPRFRSPQLTADADSASVLRSIQARVSQVHELHAISADTTRNLTLTESLLAARRGMQCSGKLDRLTIRVDSRAQRSSMGRQDFSRFSDEANDAQLISIPEIRSRRLMRAQPPNKIRVAGIESRAVLVVIGLGNLGLELLTRLCVQAQSPHLESLTLVLVDTDAVAKSREVLELWPTLRAVVSLIPVSLEPHLPQTAMALMARLEKDGLLALCVYVALDDPALAAAWERELELAVRSVARQPPLILRLDSMAESEVLLLKDEESIVLLQQAVHRSYLNDESRHTAASWAKLPFDYREDNCSEVDHFWTKANDLDRAIVPGTRPTALTVDEDLLDPLAAAEHRRWMASRAIAGWSFGPVHSEETRTHPSLVIWEQLSEVERAENRKMVRRMVSTLTAAHLVLCPLKNVVLPRGLALAKYQSCVDRLVESAGCLLPHCVVVVEDRTSFELANRLLARKDLTFSIVVAQPIAGLAIQAGLEPHQGNRLMEGARNIWLAAPNQVSEVTSRWPAT